MSLHTDFRLTSRIGASVDGPLSESRSSSIIWHSLKERFFAALKAICTEMMRGFAFLCLCLQNVSDSAPKWFKFIFLLLSIPCFKASHFFFKLAYAINQRRLRRLCSEEFFLKFYNGRIAVGGVVNVLQSLREIEGSLKRAESSESFPYHVGRSQVIS
jgi:hypothetical protein